MTVEGIEYIAGDPLIEDMRVSGRHKDAVLCSYGISRGDFYDQIFLGPDTCLVGIKNPMQAGSLHGVCKWVMSKPA